MKIRYRRAVDAVVKAVASDKFTWFVIGLFIVQALWIALSFRFPMIYDETAHFGFIQSYSEHLSPYTEDVPGNMTVQVSLFHYGLSFVYRFVHVFTNDTTFQVIILRFINIALFTVGLLLTRKLLQKVHIRAGYINVALLIFVLLPLTPLVGATINYDNLLFPLTILYMILAVDILQKRQALNWTRAVMLVTVGCFTALVKYTFLPVFLASLIFIFGYYLIVDRERLSKLGKFPTHFSLSKRSLLLAALAVFAVGLFSITYIRNVAVYGSIKPSCTELLSKKECLSNGIIARNAHAKETAAERPVEPLYKFASIWVKNMVTMSGLSGNSTTKGAFVLRKPLPIMTLTVFLGLIVSLGVLLYSWRSLEKNIGWYFLLAMFVVLVAALFVVNAKSYYSLHVAYANQPRYLLSLLPIFIAVAVAAIGLILKKRRTLKVIILLTVVALFSQGGGVITHIVRSDDNWYWQNNVVVGMNHAAKRILQPLVKE